MPPTRSKIQSPHFTAYWFYVRNQMHTLCFKTSIRGYSHCSTSKIECPSPKTPDVYMPHAGCWLCGFINFWIFKNDILLSHWLTRWDNFVFLSFRVLLSCDVNGMGEVVSQQFVWSWSFFCTCYSYARSSNSNRSVRLLYFVYINEMTAKGVKDFQQHINGLLERQGSVKWQNVNLGCG